MEKRLTTELIAQFRDWLASAEQTEPYEANAMSLATVGQDGLPAVRMVLLKTVDERGFVFYTNLGSQKAHELIANPQAALCFHWKSQRRQIRVQGSVSPVSAAEADAYFATRSRNSQIGAWASRQSEVLADHATLEQRIARYTLQFGTEKIPRPEFWSGFLVQAQVIEFWQDGAFRLHERIRYERQHNDDWLGQTLYP